MFFSHIRIGKLDKMMYLRIVKSVCAFLEKYCARLVLLVTVLFGLGLGFSPSARAQVVLNEIMADNSVSVPNGADYPDWIELYNTSLSTVNIGGFMLSNPPSSTYVFPANTLIGPNSYLIVWCDSSTNSPGIHTHFGLGKNGDAVFLYNNGVPRGLVDSIAFGVQITDLSIGRIPNGVGAWTLNKPTPALANKAQPLGNLNSIRFNEWMALTFVVTNGPSGSGFKTNSDWFEIYNTDFTNAIDLSGVVFTDSSGTNMPLATKYKALTNLYFMPPGDFYQFFADGNSVPTYNEVNFKLSSTLGDTLMMYGSNRTTLITKVPFGPQTNNISMGCLPDGNTNNIVYFRSNAPTPKASNFLPITNIVISEVLSHTDPPYEDAIELQNISSAPVDISHWWISNRKDDYQKFQIANGTIIQPGGYKVFYEGLGSGYGFDTSGTGNSPDFRLNAAHGDSVYIFIGDAAGNLTGFRRGVDFEAAAHGISFGRYITSDTNTEFTAMPVTTFGHDNPGTVQDFEMGTGLPNPYPLVGPIVINEIMYHPPNVNGTNDDSVDEYIELHNISTTTNVLLYDAAFPTNTWKLDDAVNFSFPQFVKMPPNSYLLVVNFDPVTNLSQLAFFRSLYGIPASFTNIYGPYGGKLQNSGGTVKLYRPDTPQEPPHPDAGFVPYVLMDKVGYNDKDPWPTGADGLGSSLQRRSRTQYGNDPANWFAEGPTPGKTNTFTGTIQAHVTRAGGLTTISFTAQMGQTYTVQYKDSLSLTSWNLLTTVPPQTSTGAAFAYDTGVSASGYRFYRILTP